MQQRSVKKSVGVALTCTAVLLFGLEISLGQDTAYFYYGWGEERLPLTLSTERIGIKFEDGITPEGRASAVALHADLLEVSDDIYSRAVLAVGMSVVRAQPGKSPADIEGLIDSLSQRSDVAFATPIFQIEPGLDELLTDTFYATFPASTPVAEIDQLNARYGVEVLQIDDWPRIGKVGYSLRVPRSSGMDAREMANVYREHPLTIRATPVFYSLYSIFLTTTPNDTHYGSQWALPQVEADEGWDTTTGSSSIIIAIIDGGVDPNHEDLDGKLVAGYDFVRDSPDPVGGDHGTWVAGIAAAETNNAQGVAGVSWGAKIMPITINPIFNEGFVIANAMTWAVNNGADILSISWGLEAFHLYLSVTIQNIKNEGVVIIAAAGNSNREPPNFPASHPDVICVIATIESIPGGPTDERKRFDPEVENDWGSNYGSEADVSAPGINMYTTDIGGGYKSDFFGTSAATPMVAGLAALVLSVDPNLTPSQVQAIIQFTADDEVGRLINPLEDTPGRDKYMGYGRINVDKALQLASASPIVRLEDGEGSHVLSFDIEGNFVIEGDLVQNADETELMPASTDLWILRDPLNAVVVRVDSIGDMYIAGGLSEKVSLPSPTYPMHVFKDDNGVTVSVIDQEGNLDLMGSAFIGADPDRESSQGN